MLNKHTTKFVSHMHQMQMQYPKLVFFFLCVYYRWLIDLYLNKIGKQTPIFECMQLHADLCPR